MTLKNLFDAIDINCWLSVYEVGDDQTWHELPEPTAVFYGSEIKHAEGNPDLARILEEQILYITTEEEAIVVEVRKKES